MNAKEFKSSLLFIRTAPRLLGFLLCGFVLAGCSTFNREWKRAAAIPSSTNDIAGRWEGFWRSDVNGHNGRLRCVITRASDREYRAYYHAKYRTILSFSYTVPLHVEPADGAHKFQGEADLGWYAGGIYYYEGQAGLTNFFSTYRSKHDHGIFQMTRPEDQPR